jgi:hypothetical protein
MSCRQAVARLGADRIYDLAAQCVLRESLRSPSTAVRSRMQKWWRHAMRVSAISRVLARMSERFDPDHAATIGLLHSIAEPVMLFHARPPPGSRRRDPAGECPVRQPRRAGSHPDVVLGPAADPGAMPPGRAPRGNTSMRARPTTSISCSWRSGMRRSVATGAICCRSWIPCRRPKNLAWSNPSPKLSLKIVEAANTAVAAPRP